MSEVDDSSTQCLKHNQKLLNLDIHTQGQNYCEQCFTDSNITNEQVFQFITNIIESRIDKIQKSQKNQEDKLEKLKKIVEKVINEIVNVLMKPLIDKIDQGIEKMRKETSICLKKAQNLQTKIDCENLESYLNQPDFQNFLEISSQNYKQVNEITTQTQQEMNFIISKLHKMYATQIDKEVQKDQNLDITPLNDGVSLVGETISVKHGNFFYYFSDGTREYAGQYEKDLKQGFWNDYWKNQMNCHITRIPYSTIYEQEKNFNILNYQNGSALPLIENYDQHGKRNGQHIFYFGDFNQLLWIGSFQDDVIGGFWSIVFDGQIIGGGVFNEQNVRIDEWIEIPTNYDLTHQIIYYGNYMNGIPIGKQIISYRQQTSDPFQQIGGGNFDFQGLQQGQWVELIDNFQEQNQVISSGEYKDGQRIGNWTISQRRKQNDLFKCIGGGYYNEQGMKSGIWIDLDQSSNNECQVTYTGQYEDNVRIGKWVISYRYHGRDSFQQIGGGIYEEGSKSGHWIELHQNIWNENLITYSGEYMKGKKTGKWSIYYKQYTSDPFRCIGGGEYNKYGFKFGQWVDVHENYKDDCQVTYSGEYKNDLRIGNWITSYKYFPSDPCLEVGGGSYDNEGIKSGNWIDLHANYRDKCQVIYSGEYNNGLRNGCWMISYRYNINNPFQSIGSGNYDEKGIKQGQWVDLHENYSNDCQVIYSGEYKNGLRIGMWTISYRQQTNDQFQCIGGGCYDDKGAKQGQWVDVNAAFKDDRQVTYSGEYRNNLQIGKWNISYRQYARDSFQCVGGGFYDNEAVKSGQWIDLHDNFRDECQATFSGEYKNGLRIGKWNISYRQNTKDTFQCIGGGYYIEKAAKSGQWIELHHNFRDKCQVIYTGEYKNNTRIGKWAISYRLQTSYQFKCIGGGQYDQQGIKIGQWTDLHDNFRDKCQVIYSGEYKNGLPIKKWSISFRQQTSDPFKLIGGGSYNDNGVKFGQWVDLHSNYWNLCQVTYTGQYKKGQRIGKWTISYRQNSCDPFQSISGGFFDDKGVKQGEWIDLHDDYRDKCQVTYSGEYQNGLRKGTWTISFRENASQPFKSVGGGKYDDKGIKEGEWIDLHGNFKDDCQVTFTGQYQNGFRVGEWKKIDLVKQEVIQNITYNDKGIKIA